MKKYFAGLAAASLAAFLGFFIHVATQEPIRSWVASQMQGQGVAPSWDVRYLALITSLESGIGLVAFYAIIRKALPSCSTLARGAILALLLLMSMGRLIRQPAMNLAIGNPLAVVAVQDGISWLLWLLMSLVVALVFDKLAPAMQRKPC
jgi:hypothetical protein